MNFAARLRTWITQSVTKLLSGFGSITFTVLSFLIMLPLLISKLAYRIARNMLGYVFSFASDFIDNFLVSAGIDIPTFDMSAWSASFDTAISYAAFLFPIATIINSFLLIFVFWVGTRIGRIMLKLFFSRRLSGV